MIEVEMTKDIRDFEPKFIGPLSKRQLIFLAIGCAYGIPFMAFAPIANVMNRIVIGIGIMIPTLLCGFLKWNGAPLEYMMIKGLYHLMYPQKRKYTQKNCYREILEKLEKKEKLEAYNNLSKKEQKKANKPVVIEYSKDPIYKGYR